MGEYTKDYTGTAVRVGEYSRTPKFNVKKDNDMEATRTFKTQNRGSLNNLNQPNQSMSGKL